MKTLGLIFLCLHLTNAAIHSWKAFYTGSTGLSEFPEFVALNLIDDQVMGYFDNRINRFKSQFTWMADKLGSEYDDQQTNILQGHATSFQNNVKIVMDRFNQTQGVHTNQVMYSCEWNDETGETNGFNAHGYDGEDFFSLDLKERRFISPVQQALPTVQKLNNDNALIENLRQYLSTICIDWLKKYLQYGENYLKKTVSPQVSLLQKDSSSPVLCHATGFYPSGVKISWLKNAQDHYEDVDIGELVPNEDGTFQKTSSLKTEEWKQNQFTCVVEHQGKTINTILTEKAIKTNNGGVPVGIIVGVVAAFAMLVVIGVIGYMVYQKKGKSGFVPANTSDGGSNNSSQGAQA